MLNSLFPSGDNPDYPQILHFLLEPLLNPSESIIVDSEFIKSTNRVWVRLAVNTQDKGRLYGRGGRNLKAIRTVLSAAAEINKQSLYLDVYGGENSHQESFNRDGDSKRTAPRRTNMPKPKI